MATGKQVVKEARTQADGSKVSQPQINPFPHLAVAKCATSMASTAHVRPT